MSDEALPPIPFNSITRPEDRRSIAPEETPSEPAPTWSATLPMDQGKANSARAAWLKAGLPAEKFDEAMKEDGFIPPNLEKTKQLRAHGLHDAKPSDYQPTLSPELQKHVPELSAWVAGLRVHPNLGSAVVERLAEIGPAYKRMSPEARENWRASQVKLATRLVGGTPEKLETARAAAKEMLAREGSRFSKDLARDDGVFHDAMVLTTLAHLNDMHRSYEAAQKRKRN
jgi:hypothetical protein